MAGASSLTRKTIQPQVPLATRREEKGSLETRIERTPDPSEPANRNQREYHEWIRHCALELKKADGLSSAQRFFCAAFSLLCAGNKLVDLHREIDGTIDAETSDENLQISLQHRLGICRGGGSVRTKKYVAGYFAADAKRNREKRFHDAVLFLFYEGFTRDQLHRLAAQAEEA